MSNAWMYLIVVAAYVIGSVVGYWFGLDRSVMYYRTSVKNHNKAAHALKEANRIYEEDSKVLKEAGELYDKLIAMLEKEAS